MAKRWLNTAVVERMTVEGTCGRCPAVADDNLRGTCCRLIQFQAGFDAPVDVTGARNGRDELSPYAAECRAPIHPYAAGGCPPWTLVILAAACRARLMVPIPPVLDE
jgi:hypothetical protein